ncbi:hypothetical protein [Geitlerinema sp. PCC 7407]|uniref:hypothetical protein n=1 Tax=Geitlerinema sp. PCC 7407 TaxID=1173025 RepID=UPI0002E50458|nr:hypothetical protein [Geitlerinema sp. PCC 7407]
MGRKLQGTGVREGAVWCRRDRPRLDGSHQKRCFNCRTHSSKKLLGRSPALERT